MADYNADCTIVECIVLLHIKKWILQDTGRETDLVCCWVVVCVHGLWCHVPLFAVNGLAPLLVDVLFPSELRHVAAVLGIAECRVNGECAVVIPLVGVANLHGKCVQFLVSSLLCNIAHPFLCVDALAKCNLQVLYKLCHTLLCCRWEILGYIQLADDVAQSTVNCAHRTLPAWLLNLLSAQNSSVESKCLLLKCIAQLVRC